MKMAGIYENCRPFQKVAGHFWKCRKMADHYWKWPAIPESGWPFLKKAAHFRKWSRAISEIGKPFLKIAVHLWKWPFISKDGWSFFENDRPFLTTNGLFRNGQPFLKLEMAGHFWKCPAISEDEWLFLKMASHFWKLQAASGSGRPLWGISESGWPFLKMVGHFWKWSVPFWKWSAASGNGHISVSPWKAVKYQRNIKAPQYSQRSAPQTLPDPRLLANSFILAA